MDDLEEGLHLDGGSKGSDENPRALRA